VGLEPTHGNPYWILNPARLPIPPRRREDNRSGRPSACQLQAWGEVGRDHLALTASELEKEPSWQPQRLGMDARPVELLAFQEPP
jgi:hypothetical protein